MVSDWWLPADLAVVGEADLDVRTAAVAPECEQAVNVPLVVGRGSSSEFSPPSLEEQPSCGGCVSVGETRASQGVALSGLCSSRADLNVSSSKTISGTTTSSSGGVQTNSLSTSPTTATG